MENEMFYHIYNRGVDRRDIFYDDKDRRRFLRACILLNDDNVTSQRYPLQRDGHHPIPARKPLVDIVCYTLMNNHVHFVIKQIAKDGIARFMQRLGTSYTKYFNTRYERTGALFESTYKAVLVNDTDHFLHVTRYVHLNPLDILSDSFDRWNALVQYRWSSLPKYLLDTHDPLVETSHILNIMGKAEYAQYLRDWLPEWRKTTEA